MHDDAHSSINFCSSDIFGSSEVDEGQGTSNYSIWMLLQLCCGKYISYDGFTFYIYDPLSMPLF